MEKFIAQFKNGNEDKVNVDLITRKNDGDIVDYIANACKSLETLKYIKFIGYDVIEDESKIDINDFIYTRKKKNKGGKKEEEKKYMYITDSRYAEVILKFKLTCKNRDDDNRIVDEVIQKKILILVPDRDGYYTIKGKKYILLYQLVDSSTYKNKDRLTLKSFMPIIIKRTMQTYNDTKGAEYKAPIFTINIFKKELDIFLFYFANFGVLETLNYWSVNKIIRFRSEVKDAEKYIYFGISSKLFIEIDRPMFEKYAYVRSMVFMILNICTNRMTIESLYKNKTWIEKIGATCTTNINNYYEKGMNRLTSFDRMIDETTKKVLKINPDHKQSIFSIVRWMVQNYDELHTKDNMSLVNKRLRCNEYIASLLTKVFSERLNRIISMGDKATMKEVKQIFKFKGDAIITELYSAGLLRFDDAINDMDLFNRLKYTSKGPNALGSKNANNISTRYRGIHPSYLGRIDINVCGEHVATVSLIAGMRK